MTRPPLSAAAVLAFAIGLLLFLSGCQRSDALQQILDRGELRVATIVGPTSYYLDANGPTGFEYALAQAFADELGVALRVTVIPNRETLLAQLRRKQHDLAAASLSYNRIRAKEFPIGAAYGESQTILLYRTGTFRPQNLADLQDYRVLVLADSSGLETLEQLQRAGLEELSWEVIEQKDSFDLLEAIDRGDADYAVMESREFYMYQAVFARLAVALELGAPRELVWLLAPQQGSGRLQRQIDLFFSQLTLSGKLAALEERHFGHSDDVERIESHTFLLAVERSLPDYQALIEQIAAEFKIEWELLAAIAYQESHWNPRATSRTGVRGMMMLTERTAGELGVRNRLNAEQSLRGGAQYLLKLRDKLPERVAEPDRTWLALAAYNIGPGHLEDARALTERLGGDPDRWVDVRDTLPLLQERRYFRQTRLGYARGAETVQFVQNVRHYHKVLQWRSLAQTRPQAPAAPADYLPDSLRALTLPAL